MSGTIIATISIMLTFLLFVFTLRKSVLDQKNKEGKKKRIAILFVAIIAILQFAQSGLTLLEKYSSNKNLKEQRKIDSTNFRYSLISSRDSILLELNKTHSDLEKAKDDIIAKDSTIINLVSGGDEKPFLEFYSGRDGFGLFAQFTITNKGKYTLQGLMVNFHDQYKNAIGVIPTQGPGAKYGLQLSNYYNHFQGDDIYIGNLVPEAFKQYLLTAPIGLPDFDYNVEFRWLSGRAWYKISGIVDSTTGKMVVKNATIQGTGDTIARRHMKFY